MQEHYAVKSYRGSGRSPEVSRILDKDTGWRLMIPQGKEPLIPIVQEAVLEKKKSLPLPGIEPLPSSFQAVIN
jgi:hypothetical protein